MNSKFYNFRYFYLDFFFSLFFSVCDIFPNFRYFYLGFFFKGNIPRYSSWCVIYNTRIPKIMVDLNCKNGVLQWSLNPYPYHIIRFDSVYCFKLIVIIKKSRNILIFIKYWLIQFNICTRRFLSNLIYALLLIYSHRAWWRSV